MSGLDRKAMRAAARSALRGVPGLGSFTEIDAWAQKVDARTLPCWGIATPREARNRDTHDKAEESLTLAVVVKRVGGDDLEDAIDDDADLIVPAVVRALRSIVQQCELGLTEVRLDGEGAQRIATLTLSFTVTYWVEDPA